MPRKVRFMKLIMLLVLIALALIPACSGSGTTPMPDSIDPGEGGQISLETPEVRFYPQDARTNVVTTTDIELFFNVDMDESNDWMVVVFVNGSEYATYDRNSLSGVSWQRRALAIVPADPFAQGSTVRIDAIGFASLQGVSMPDRTATFTVVQYAAPTVAITPVNNAINVIPGVNIRFEFNLPVKAGVGTVTINGDSYPTGTWSGNTLTINPPGYFDRGEVVTVTATGFMTAYGDVPFPDAGATFTIGSDAHSISWGDSEPLAITAPLKLSFDSDVNLDCGSGDPNCEWTVTASGFSYTIVSGESDIKWITARELDIVHTGTYLLRGGQTATAGILYDTSGYPFGNGLVPVAIPYDVKINPGMTSSPHDGEANVSISTNIVFSFDEPVKYNCGWTVNIPGNTYGEGDQGTSWNALRTQLTIDPADFTPGVEVQMNATGFKAEDDEPFNDLVNVKFTPSVIPVTGVMLNAANLRIVKGRTATLTANFTPTNATYQTVTWSSTDNTVATVGSGNPATVTAVKQGTAVITVTTDDGAYKASCRVMVVTPHFVVVGDEGRVTNSPDGASWTAGSQMATSLQNVIQGGGKYVAVGVGGYRAWSTNGMSWTQYVDGYSSGSTLHHVAYGDGTFVAVRDASTDGLKSTDGENWSSVDTKGTYTGVVYGKSMFVAVGFDWQIGYSDSIEQVWTQFTVPDLARNMHDIVFDKDNGKFVAISWDSVALSSTDGANWTKHTVGDIGGSGFLNSIAYGDGWYVAVGNNGRIVCSKDLKNWSIVRSESTESLDSLMSVTYGNETFVAVGAGWRREQITYDGENWQISTVNGTCGDPEKKYCHYRGVCYSEEEPYEGTYFIVGGEPIMLNEPVQSGITFPVGIDDMGDINNDASPDIDSPVTINYDYVVGETEVTYRQWRDVYLWATTDAGGGKRSDGGELYVFANAGARGCGASTTDLHPVTAINWRDAIVWCNALTEFCNKDNATKLECVYHANDGFSSPHRSSVYDESLHAGDGEIDHPYVNTSAGGFRLLIGDEWELAARFIKDAVPYGVLTLMGEYYQGNFASGADDVYYVSPVTSDYDGNEYFASSANVAVYAAENGKGVGTAPVRSKWPNAMGLYDMSGNVWEWCFDLSPSSISGERLRIGGGFNHTSYHLQIGERYSGKGDPWNAAADVGFRVTRKLP